MKLTKNMKKHEWGHIAQQSIIGTPKFMQRIAMPSIISAGINPGNENYYLQPWERTADFFGGANNGYYSNVSDFIAGLYYICP